MLDKLGMPLRTTWRFGQLEICLRTDLADDESAAPARPFPMNLFREPAARISAANLYKALKGRPPADLANSVLIAETINDRLRAGDLVIIARRSGSGSAGDGTSGKGSQTRPSRASSSSSDMPPKTDPVKDKTWVDVQLIDEEGEPVAGARYILKITDGSKRAGTLDASGRVRVTNIDPGTCEVWFPDFDASEWSRSS